MPSPSDVRRFIESSLAKIPSYGSNREKQVAFYGASFTAMSREVQTRYLEAAQPFLSSGLIHSLRISTRPDALAEDILGPLTMHGVKTVEIGAQSMDNHVLASANRGHRAEATTVALSRLKAWKFEVGVQLMMGLPGDSLNAFLDTLDQLIERKPDFVRIHPTLVFKGAPLEPLWRSGRYSPLSVEETIAWLKRGLLKLEKGSIPVARIGLQPTKELEDHFLAGPYHPSLRHVVDSAIAFDMAAHLLENTSQGCDAQFRCHPKDVSTLRGLGNENMRKLRDRFHLRKLFCGADESLSRGSLGLRTREGLTLIHRKDLQYDEI